jgi:hypothetical protein
MCFGAFGEEKVDLDPTVIYEIMEKTLFCIRNSTGK